MNRNRERRRKMNHSLVFYFGFCDVNGKKKNNGELGI